MTSGRQVAVEPTDHENLNAVHEKPTVITTEASKENEKKVARIGSLIGLLFFLIGSCIPIIELTIGRRYAEECPADWHIPHYLVVAGSVRIVVVILGIVKSVLAYKISQSGPEYTPKISLIGVLLCVTSILCALILFLSIWFLCGCYWVFRSRNIIQYTDHNQDNYCHPTLYKFAFWLLLVSIFFKLFACCQSCWKTPHSIKQKNKNKLPTVTGP